MAKNAVQHNGIAIRLACEAFHVSESCYRYESKQSAENEAIANWPFRLTDNHRKWGFGLCFLYLRNVKIFTRNHKRVSRIYRELELKLRVKPRRRLVRDKPQAIRSADLGFCHNGPQYISKLIQDWAEDMGIRLDYIQPGNPQQNAYVERFNRSVRYEWLSQNHWSTIDEVQEHATQWTWSYNHDRPHMALGGLTPKQHLAKAA